MRVAVIPGKGGSVRIPGKNVRHFFGKPIIAYSIECAKDSGLFDRIVVSTDDDNIARTARRYGATSLMRGKELAQVGTQEIVRRAISYEDHFACCIYATAPLLTPEDLQRGWRALIDRGACFAFAVGTEPLRDAGAFYWGRAWAFLQNIPLVGEHSVMVPLPESRVQDINVEAEWLAAEQKYNALHKILEIA